MVDPTSSSAATHWLFCLYTNEFNWLFCWSYFTMVTPTAYSPPATSFNERFSSWLKMVKDPTLRNARLYEAPLSNRKYYIFYASMSAITILRLALNFAGFMLVLLSLYDYAPNLNDYSENADLPYEYTMQTFRVLESHHLAKIGGWCFLASTILHVVAYLVHKNMLMRLLHHGSPDEAFSVPHYFAGHISIINWLLDVPGFYVPTTTWIHILILLINLTAGFIFFCALWFEKPMTLAWGCYAPGTRIRDLSYGLCPQYINDPQNAHPPVCDQPGVRCGEEGIRWKNLMRESIIQTGFIMVVSLALYLTSISARSRFYILSRDLVSDIAETNKKNV